MSKEPNVKNERNTPLRFSMDVTLAAKGIAVVLMLIHHLFVCCPELAEGYGVSSKLFSLDQIYQISTLSKICVATFVFLTAYGMSVTAAGKKPNPVKRLKKLLPSFWVVYLAAILTCFMRPDHLSIYFGEGKFKGLVYMVMDACGLSNMVGTPMYNETWWYMTLAILLIFLLPIAIAAYNKYGLCVLGIAALIPYFGVPMNPGTTYLFAAALGIWAANSGIFGKLKEWTAKKTIVLPLLVTVVLFAGFSLVRLRIGMVYWTDAILAFLLILAMFLLIDCTPLKLRGCVFLGKHSMNIFLVHTLIFEYYCTKWIYRPGNWLLITILLVISSLLVSLVLTPIQKFVLKCIR